MDYKRMRKLFDEKVEDREAFFKNLGMSESGFYKVIQFQKTRVETLEKISQALGVSPAYWWISDEDYTQNYQAVQNVNQLKLAEAQKEIDDLKTEIKYLRKEIRLLLDMLEEKINQQFKLEELAKGGTNGLLNVEPGKMIT